MAGAWAETWGAGSSSPPFSHEVFSCWNTASNCVIYITDITCIPSAPCVSASFSAFIFRFEGIAPAAKCTCSNRFQIQKISFDELSLTKTTSWKLRSLLPYILRRKPTHSLIHFNQLCFICYIKKKSVLLSAKRLHKMNEIIGYSYAKTIMNSI